MLTVAQMFEVRPELMVRQELEDVQEQDIHPGFVAGGVGLLTPCQGSLQSLRNGGAVPPGIHVAVR